VSVFNSTEGSLRVPQQASSKGYKEVADYMATLLKKPFNSDKDTMGAAAAADPQIADLMSKLKGHHVALTKAKKMEMHAHEMKEVLQQYAEGVTLAEPQNPTPLQVEEAKQQMAQLNKAIGHERKAEKAWRYKHRKISEKIKAMETEMNDLQKGYVKRDAKAKTAYLQRLATDKVDFNTWRATHTGKDYQEFLAFKAKDKTKAQKDALDKKLEGIRTKIEDQLAVKMRQELTSVKSEVAGMKGHGAKAILGNIEQKSERAVYRATAYGTKAINKATLSLMEKLDADTKNSLQVINEAKNFKQDKRVRLETAEQKQQRLSGLYAAGILRPKDPETLAIQEKEQAKTQKILSPLQYSASTEGKMMETDVNDPQVIAANKAEMVKLSIAVKQQEAAHRKWEQTRREKVQKYASKAVSNEDAAQNTEQLQMRMAEAKAKYHALEAIKVMNKKLAGLGGFNDVKEMAAERKGKKEIKAIDKKVKEAKKVVDRYATISDDKKVQLDALLSVDKTKTIDNNVLPVDTKPKGAAARL